MVFFVHGGITFAAIYTNYYLSKSLLLIKSFLNVVATNVDVVKNVDAAANDIDDVANDVDAVAAS